MHAIAHERKCRSNVCAGPAHNGENLISIKESSGRAGFIDSLYSPLRKKS